MLPFPFDWKNPDYPRVFAWRAERLARIRRTPGAVDVLKAYYRDNLPQFIADWGCIYEPRNAPIGMPVVLPLLPFPRQTEWLEWVIERWHAQELGLTDKSRGSGMSWLAVAIACALCIFRDNVKVGFGSRKEEYVDKLGDSKALLEKVRLFMQLLPPEFRGGWNRAKHGRHMLIEFPQRKSVIIGEVGDTIGRGDRTALYFIDEAAFIEHQQLVWSGVSDTADCRIFISTPGTTWGHFAEQRYSLPARQVFTFHWRDDPRRDDAWRAKKVLEDGEENFAREYDCNHRGAVASAVIPADWVQAAIGAHLKLGIEPTGKRCGGLDVADEGVDKNAFAGRYGILLEHLEQWSGKGSDIFQTVVRAFSICEERGYPGFDYDADGLGAGVRGDALEINAQRIKAGKSRINDEPFRGSAAVDDPEGEMVEKRKNKDYFLNLKAQSWWALRLRFQETYRAVVEGMKYDANQIISIDSNLPELTALTMELSQPTYSINTVGKIMIDKKPDGTMSPNLADAVMIAFQPGKRRRSFFGVG